VTEIPEHLLKRAQQAREKAEAEAAPAAPAAEAETPEAASDPRIPAHLLERSKAAKAKTVVLLRCKSALPALLPAARPQAVCHWVPVRAGTRNVY
jgi:hypothetical protein